MMKVPAKLRTAFERQLELNEVLRAAAEEVIAGFRRTHWHYEGRLKGLESFALKVESGRVSEPAAMEDFFACTLVVRNAAEVPFAEATVRSHFRVVQRRPPDPTRTHKAADAFPFDDLRLYVTLKPSELTPARDIENITFEVQIKTFLQHAWAIATHDLLYKSNDVRWGKARIAYQIKAMLEHAELAIEEVEPLAMAKGLARSDRRTEEVAALIEEVKKRWPSERLPRDLRRLAENILVALGHFRMSVGEFGVLVDQESAAGRGVGSFDLSPYAATIQGLVIRRTDKLDRFLRGRDRARLSVPEHIEVPDGVQWPPVSNRVVVV